MRERRIVIVAFDQLQPLDVVGPHEVFAGATRVAARLGRPSGYAVTVVSRHGGPVRAESGLELGSRALPGDDTGRLDTLVITELHVGHATPAERGNEYRQTIRATAHRRPVRLHLPARLCLEPDDRFSHWLQKERAHELLHPRLAAPISPLLDLAEQNGR